LTLVFKLREYNQEALRKLGILFSGSSSSTAAVARIKYVSYQLHQHTFLGQGHIQQLPRALFKVDLLGLECMLIFINLENKIHH